MKRAKTTALDRCSGDGENGTAVRAKRFWQACGGAALSLAVMSAAGVATADMVEEPTPAEQLTAAAQDATVGLDPQTAATVESTVAELAALPEVVDNGSEATIERADGSTLTIDGGNVIAVPATADTPVEIRTADGTSVEIDLPVPAGTEAVVVDGVSVYPTEHGSIAQQATEGGGVQTVFTLDGPQAPTSYPVSITVNDGGGLQLLEDGSVAVINPDGSSISGIGVPWARDGNGAAVPTRFEVVGNTVTQHIDTSAVSAWPVIADPFWSGFSNYMRCILGVGVPLGVAAVFVTFLGWAGAWSALRGAISAGTPLPGWGTIVRWYLTPVWNSCYRFVKS